MRDLQMKPPRKHEKTIRGSVGTRTASGTGLAGVANHDRAPFFGECGLDFEWTMYPRIDRPIFFLGPGRAGSTLLHELITHHRDVACFVSWSSRYPRLTFLSIGARLRSPWLEKKASRIKLYPGPTEPYGVWKYCFPDFWRICERPCRDPRGAEKFRRLVRDHLRFQARSRFLAKLTGPPMFAFLESIFPDARFVWLDRDPRAVTYSYSLRRKFREPPGTPEEKVAEVRLCQAAERYLSFYDRLQAYDGDYLTLLYEDLIADPVAEMARLLQYLELAEDRRLLRLAAEWPVRRDANRAWEEKLGPSHRALLTRLLDRPLRDRRYLGSGTAPRPGSRGDASR